MPTEQAEHKLGEHVEGCDGEFTELHRIDPEQSRPPLGTTEVKEDGSLKFRPKLGRDKKPILGKRKYTEKVIVTYCPTCGAKGEEPWTE